MTFEKAQRAIKTGNLLSIRHELDRGLDAGLSNRFSWTLLMLAGLEGNVRIGELLIEQGAGLDEMNNFGETALSLAAHQGHAPFFELLLAKGASPECQPHGYSLEYWVKETSGLPPEKVATILGIIDSHRRKP